MRNKATRLPPLEAAVLQTVAYVDMFDYPPTAAEVYRYLVRFPATEGEVRRVLGNGRLIPDHLEQQGDFFALPGRKHIIQIRQRRENVAKEMWPSALRYGRLIACLPFVRMVAVTGSLAVNNVEPDADIDFLVVTRPGRLWLCRAFTILLVKHAARQNISMCPNYFLSERALVFEEENLYTAHELTQMIPLSGLAVYWRIRYLNSWVSRFLPNASSSPRSMEKFLPTPSRPRRWLRGLLEAGLLTPPGGWVERWEMERKIRKFSRQAAGVEATFSADWCKGHFDSHGRQALEDFDRQWQELEGQI